MKFSDCLDPPSSEEVVLIKILLFLDLAVILFNSVNLFEQF